MERSNIQLNVIIERSDGHFWGRIEDHGFMPTGQGETCDQMIQNLKESIQDYIENEGKEDPFWSTIDLASLNFTFLFDLAAFFEEFDELKISSIARRAGINESLMRQYATGNKYPSAEQASKIEKAVHELAERLMNLHIFAD